MSLDCDTGKPATVVPNAQAWCSVLQISASVDEGGVLGITGAIRECGAMPVILADNGQATRDVPACAIHVLDTGEQAIPLGVRFVHHLAWMTHRCEGELVGLDTSDIDTCFGDASRALVSSAALEAERPQVGKALE